MTTVEPPTGMDLAPFLARHAIAEHRRFTQPPALILQAVWASADDVPVLAAEIEALRRQIVAVKYLHTDSVAGVCPSCGRLGDVDDHDDGLVDYPCPTIQAITPMPPIEVGVEAIGLRVETGEKK